MDNEGDIHREYQGHWVPWGPGKPNDRDEVNKRSVRLPLDSSMMNPQTGNASSLRWVGGWYETGCRGGGCHMD